MLIQPLHTDSFGGFDRFYIDRLLFQTAGRAFNRMAPASPFFARISTRPRPQKRGRYGEANKIKLAGSLYRKSHPVRCLPVQRYNFGRILSGRNHCVPVDEAAIRYSLFSFFAVPADHPFTETEVLATGCVFSSTKRPLTVFVCCAQEGR